MTWQQSRPNRHWGTTAVVLGERTDWRRGFPEKTFAAHGVSLPCRWSGGACECTAMSEEQASFYVIKKISLLVQGEYTVSLLIWPWVLLLWLFIGPWLRFCAEETPAESWLPADRPDSWTHGWMAAHPIKPTCSGKGVKPVRVCDSVSTNCLSVSLDTFLMCVCASVCMFEFILTDSSVMRVKAKQLGGLIEEAGRQILRRLQTAGQSMPLFQYISVCMWVCIKNTNSLLSLIPMHHGWVISMFQTSWGTVPLNK